MTYKIIQDFIKLGSKCRPGKKNPKKWIVIHETGNSSPKAGAKNHSNYIKNLAIQNKTYLSWHYSVDDKEIYQHIPDDEISWNAGDGQKIGGGNMAGISIEICVNSGSDFKEALNNAAYLTGYLLLKHNLDISAVKQHFDFSGKNCPQKIRESNLWNEFLKKCEYYKKAIKL
ncbi:MAG: N-acetylmuramoyl-L-alanine amidase [Oscillospiraceae bacterium]|nr:N-acetylmuramoyl-L-alanine amidase [Oscillospiraceae bacterium]